MFFATRFVVRLPRCCCWCSSSLSAGMASPDKSAGSVASFDGGSDGAGAVERSPVQRRCRGRCWGLPAWAWLLIGFTCTAGVVTGIVFAARSGSRHSASAPASPPSVGIAPPASSRPASPSSSAATQPAPTVSPIAGLHRSFYGIAYEPSYIRPSCANVTQAGVTEDIAIVSQRASDRTLSRADRGSNHAHPRLLERMRSGAPRNCAQLTPRGI